MNNHRKNTTKRNTQAWNKLWIPNQDEWVQSTSCQVGRCKKVGDFESFLEL